MISALRCHVKTQYLNCQHTETCQLEFVALKSTWGGKKNQSSLLILLCAHTLDTARVLFPGWHFAKLSLIFL